MKQYHVCVPAEVRRRQICLRHERIPVTGKEFLDGEL